MSQQERNTAEQTTYYLRQVRSAADSLRSALAEVKRGSDAALEQMGRGQRASGGTQLLGQCVRDADAAYAKVNTLLDLAAVFGVDEGELSRAYLGQ
jgi:hypothetical protein